LIPAQIAWIASCVLMIFMMVLEILHLQDARGSFHLIVKLVQRTLARCIQQPQQILTLGLKAVLVIEIITDRWVGHAHSATPRKCDPKAVWMQKR